MAYECGAPSVLDVQDTGHHYYGEPVNFYQPPSYIDPALPVSQDYQDATQNPMQGHGHHEVYRHMMSPSMHSNVTPGHTDDLYQHFEVRVFGV